MKETLEVSVVIPVFNQSHLTEQCLNSLLKNSSSRLEIIVINNASVDNTESLLKDFELKFSSKNIPFYVHNNKENVGFGRAMNQGARVAKGKYVALLNNDTWLMKGWDLSLISSIEKYNAQMVCPYFYEGKFDEENLTQRAKTFIEKNKNSKTKEWGSILMFFNLESFKELGMFDEDYFVTYEDDDLRFRADKKNYRYYLVGNCFIWHHSKGTRSKDSKPSVLEEQGLSIFMRKWGFDPGVKKRSFLQRQLRSFRKLKRKYGCL